MNNIKLFLYIIFAILFVLCFININGLNKFRDILASYNYQLIFLVIILYIYTIDRYIATLIFIIFMIQYKISYKEYYQNTIGFKMDPVKKQEILERIKAQLEFNINKTDLQRETINKIYETYFGDDEAKQLLVLEEEALKYNPIV